MSIKLKLVLLAAVPLVVIAGFGVEGTVRNARVSGEMRDIRALADLAVRVSATVHETQKERGRTAGFLGSKGTKFAAELDRQRDETDARAAELREHLEGFDAERFGPGFAEGLAAALGELDRLAERRRAVSDLSLATGEALGYYTKMNARFLDTIGEMAQVSGDAALTREIAAYVLFLKGKERAGIERAVLTNTFAADRFGPGMYRKFVSLVTQQETYLSEFAALATADAAAYLTEASGDAAFAEVVGFRDIAFANADAGGFGVDPGVWFATITRKIDGLKGVEDALSLRLQEQAAAAESAAGRAVVWVAGAVGLVVLLGLVGAWLTMRSVTRPLGGLVATIAEIQTSNDLTLRVDRPGRDELARLGRSFDALVGTLREIIGQVRQSGEEVAAAATEVAACSEELTTTMGEQSSQVTSIGAAVEEMSASVVEVSRQAADAAADADRAGTVARDGQGVVGQTVSGMEGIHEAVTHSAQAVSGLGQRGEQIGQIIAVINDIADQTNLLALNAAIEAARAGEHGRGFAVVADEVRKLADRTTQATDEISASITAIQDETARAVERMNTGTQQVEAGVEAATRAGGSLEQIVGTSDGLAQKVQAIAAAAEQQSLASQAVATGIESIEAGASQSYEGTRQAAEASDHLSRKAEDLRELVSRFTT
ncbi:MAG: methyl-accepting chemotaxis protein [Planctomycetota bacterium]